MKILLIQHQDFINGTGGTEKICVFLANGFAASGHGVVIGTNQNVQGGSMFALHPNVVLTNIYSDNIVQRDLTPLFNYRGKNPFLWIKYKLEKKVAKAKNRRILKKMGGKDALYVSNLRARAKAWKAYIEQLQPDLIITMTIASLLEITYENQLHVPIINSTNGRPDHDFTDVLWYRSEVEMRLLKESYKHLQAIQILFDSYQSYLPDNFKGICETIPNPVLGMREQDMVTHENKKRYKIIHLGRLACSHKQQHLLIDAFARLADTHQDWDLEFWGEGDDYTRLLKQIRNLKLQQRIFLRGFTDAPSSKLKEADIFAFPSRHEGFPLALAEAMYLGLPNVGLSDCCGVNEMIVHGVNGYLAEDVYGLSEYLKELMDNPEKRLLFGQKAHETIKHYDFDFVFDKWEKLANSVVKA